MSVVTRKSRVAADLAAKADLVAGKIPSTQLPAIAVGELFPVASQAAMLALTAQIGDVAVRSDLGNKRFLLLGNSATLADWKSIDDTATGGVTTVNGQSGIVVLGAGDVGAIPAAQAGTPSGVATLGPDGLLLAGQRPASSGAGTQVYLSSRVSAPQTVTRTPRPVESGAFAKSIMWDFIPTANASFYGITDTALHAAATTNIRLQVWRVSDMTLLASGTDVPVASHSGGAYTSALPTPLPLTAGITYRIGWAALNGNVNRAASNTGAPTTFTGFSTDRISYFPDSTFGYPANPVGNPDQYPVTFDLLVTAPSTTKNVQNPLDAADFPIVAAVADLAMGAVALLDPGTSAPRLVRRRADGTVWYGPVFTSVP